MKLLAGKPLIQWTIEAAQKSVNITGIIISTDDKDFPKHSNYSVHLRRPELATDTATVFDVCKDILSSPLPFRTDQFVLLLPTSPLRTSSDIDSAYSKLWSSNADCLMSISEYEYPPQWALTIEQCKLWPRDEEFESKRQDLTPTYKHDGSIIMAKTKPFLKADDWLDLNPIPFLTDPNRSIDIDNEMNFKFAEFLLGGGQ